MSPSLALFNSGLGVFAAILLLMLAASILTLLASTFSLWLYRRYIARLMSAEIGKTNQRINIVEPAELALTVKHDPDARKIDPIPLPRKKLSADYLYRLTISESRFHAYKYAVAGILFALLTGLAGFFALSQTQVNYLQAANHPYQFLFMFWTFAWPTVLAINIVAANSLKNKCLIVLGYFVVLLGLGGMLTLIPTEAAVQLGNATFQAWSGETPFRLTSKWNIYNLPPTLLFILFQNRHVRAVAPLVLSFMTVVSTGVIGIIATAFVYQEISVAVLIFVSETFDVSIKTAFIWYMLLLTTITLLLFAVLGWWFIIWIRSSYQSKKVSDQSLSMDALWLIFASFYAAILAFSGPGWALSAFIAFIILKITVNQGNKILWPKNYNHYCQPSLLLLRVFALGKRSQVLFDVLSSQWRYIGNVRLIAGTDLAISTVAPHQFLAFISGKLRQLFISDQITLDRNLAELDTRQDQDGRFRINDFFCYADTWQNVLSRLVKSTGVVLMDLRTFSKKHDGCIFEIKELFNTIPLRQLIFVIDETTDKEFLKETFEKTCHELRSSSPNLGASASLVQPFELKSSAYTEIQRLIRQLCDAVGL